jgi:cytochrome bd-type quinol oxidase subunit 2
MGDHQGLSRQIAAYGATAQPAIAARMAPQMRLTQIGTVCGVLGVLAAGAAVVMFPTFAGAGPGLVFAVIALISAAAMLAICVIQVAVWRRAMASWLGKRVQDLHSEARLSWIAHLASYGAALVALFTTMAGSAAAGWTSVPAVLLGLALLFVLAAQVLAGVQFLRPSGPPGTLPAHMRRLSRQSRYRND